MNWHRFLHVINWSCRWTLRASSIHLWGSRKGQVGKSARQRAAMERTLCYTKAMPNDPQEPDPDSRQLTVRSAARVSARVMASVVIPAIIADAGEHAAKRFLEFFAATIRNRNTRMAYTTAVGRFFGWCE